MDKKLEQKLEEYSEKRVKEVYEIDVFELQNLVKDGAKWMLRHAQRERIPKQYKDKWETDIPLTKEECFKIENNTIQKDQALISGEVATKGTLCRHDILVINRKCEECGNEITYVPDEDLV